MTGLEKIVEQILEEANTQSDMILEDAQKKADQIIEDAKVEADKIKAGSAEKVSHVKADGKQRCVCCCFLQDTWLSASYWRSVHFTIRA